MNSNVRALVFDLDGTLIDSRGDIARAVNHVLVSSGRTTLPEATIASFVGDGALTLIQRATGLPTTDPELSLLHDQFRTYYAAHATLHTVVYPGVRETLTALRTSPYKLALNTNKPRVITDRVLAELELANLFHATVCADDLTHKKPHPEPLFFLARQLAVPPTQLVMIGDGPQDVNCGKAAGARTVGVTYGIKSAAEMRASHPDFSIDRIAEILILFPWRSASPWTNV